MEPSRRLGGPAEMPIDEGRDLNPAVAQLLLGMPPDVLRRSVSEPVLDANRRFFRAVGDWLGEHGWSGRPELKVMVALWIGPAQECSRYWLATADSPSLSALADDLADGAWSALRPRLGRDTASPRPSSART